MPSPPLRAHGWPVLAPVLLVVLLCLLDVALTAYAIRPEGPAREANPVGVLAYAHGPLGLLTVKLAAVALALQLLKPVAQWSPRAAAGTASFAAAGMAGVCMWNLHVLVA